MSDNPLVTIMIPTYRQAHLVAEAIESALAQDYSNLEVVVTDDCSPDDTADAVAPFLSDARLRYVRHATNLGRTENYRHSLKQIARGAWYLNLDGDDYLIDSGYISAAMAIAGSDPEIVLVCGNAIWADANHASGALMNEPLKTTLLTTGQAFLLEHPPLLSSLGLPHLAALFRRDQALAIDFYRLESACCDSESLYRIGLGRKIAIINRVSAVWRQQGGNASHLSTKDRLHAFEARAAGILEWSCRSNVFSSSELRRLRTLLAAGCKISDLQVHIKNRQFSRVLLGVASALLNRPAIGLRCLWWLSIVGFGRLARSTRCITTDVKRRLPVPSAAVRSEKH